MKNLSNRNKTFLAIAAVAIVVVAGLLVLQPPPIDELFGATSNLLIMPVNASIPQGATVGFQVNATNCAWTSSNPNVAELLSAVINTAQFKGVGLGQTTITAKCALVGTGTTTLTVVPRPTITPTPPPTSQPTRTPVPPTTTFSRPG